MDSCGAGPAAPAGMGGHAPDPNKHIDLEQVKNGSVKEEYLHPCCQKELQADRIRTRVMTKLTAADVTRQAMERRQNVIGVGAKDPSLHHRHEHGSACCPLTTDYPALQRLRASRGGCCVPMPPAEGVVVDFAEHRQHQQAREEDDDDEEEDSDDELLRELEEGDDDGFMEIRLAEMMRKVQEAEELRHLGIGLHTEVPNARVLDLVHLRCHIVYHFYDPQSDLGAALDLCLEDLAAQYPGTRFVRSSFQTSRPFLEKMRIPDPIDNMKAVLVTIRDGCLVDHCSDFGRRFGSGVEIYRDVLEQWLRHCHVLITEAPDLAVVRRLAGERDKDKGNRTSGVLRRGEGGEEEEEEEDAYYECGLEGCRKTFQHSHVGLGELPKEFDRATTLRDDDGTTQ